MLRKIAGVIAGYAFMFAFIVGTFSALYAVLGTERSYQPKSYEVSTLWIVLSTILGLIAAICAGWICRLISRSRGTVKVFAAIVLVLGIITAVYQMMSPRPDIVREGNVSGAEAFSKSVTPTWVAGLNPILGAIGILIGGGLRKED